MIEEIFNMKSAADEVCEEILKQQNTGGGGILVCYGNAEYAGCVTKLLSKNGIQIDDYFTDSSENGLCYDDIKKKYKEFSVIIGFYKPEILKEKIKNLKCKQCKNIYYMKRNSIHSGGVGFGFYTSEWVRENRQLITKAYELCNDELSRKTFSLYIKARLKDDVRYLHPVYIKEQYFTKGVLAFSDNEIVVDAGAYTGDTLEAYLTLAALSFKKYYAFEPDNENYEKLLQLVKKKEIDNVKLHKSGLGERKEERIFEEKAIGSRVVEKSEENKFSCRIQIESIDEAAPDATFIKADVEGMEMELLSGARQTILRNKPKLAICVYHRAEDIFSIPLLLKEWVPEYKIYFRQHDLNQPYEMVCYALIE